MACSPACDKARTVRLYGQMASGERIDVSIVPNPGAASGWLTCSGKASIGDGKARVSCSLNPLTVASTR